jgi:type IV secretion system protein TrbL
MLGLSGGGYDGLFKSVLLKVFFVGIGYTFLLRAHEWAPMVLSSFMQVGEAVSGAPLNPGEVFVQGGRLAWTMIEKVGLYAWASQPAGAFIAYCAALMVILAFGYIAIELAITLVESYVVTGVGVFLLAFLPFRGTAGITERYFGYVIAVGLKLFMLYALIGAGMQIAPTLAEMVANAPAVDVMLPWRVAFGAVLFGALAFSAGKLASSLALGAVSMGFGDILSVSREAIQGAMIAAAAPAGGAAALGAVKGLYGIAKAGAQERGGGVRGMIGGAADAGMAFSQEALRSQAPRMLYSSERLKAKGGS